MALKLLLKKNIHSHDEERTRGCACACVCVCVRTREEKNHFSCHIGVLKHHFAIKERRERRGTKRRRREGVGGGVVFFFLTFVAKNRVKVGVQRKKQIYWPIKSVILEWFWEWFYYVLTWCHKLVRFVVSPNPNPISSFRALRANLANLENAAYVRRVEQTEIWWFQRGCRRR